MDNLTKSYKLLGFELIPKTEKKIKENLKKIQLIDHNFNQDDLEEEKISNYVYFNLSFKNEFKIFIFRKVESLVEIKELVSVLLNISNSLLILT